MLSHTTYTLTGICTHRHRQTHIDTYTTHIFSHTHKHTHTQAAPEQFTLCESYVLLSAEVAL